MPASEPRLPARAAVGLGLRRALLPELLAADPAPFDFLECAPDNWVGIGGLAAEQLRTLSRRVPLTCHGLSLSLGGVAPLDREFLAATRRFLDAHEVALYSEHLSWCDDGAQLYELLPLPHSEEAVRHVAARIRQAQDALGRRIAIENVSRYATPPAGASPMSEADFVRAVLAEADCDLLLDVNNVQVNALNVGVDARAFIAAMPSARIACLHVAGHDTHESGLRIDTHGRPVDEAVWALLAHAYACHGPRPTLLERDSQLPPLAVLADELARIRAVRDAATAMPA
ncbi:DUF692 domain-containing protein [Stenotrophomonas sp. HITSZ_GD]|uniref:HvfB family MNIO-type RiPP peptide maturase n=1 Tax=Stenotrophomonas sp. HITSZ_GD TaxID=3037248 RepID=UPI00240E8445|nr:DUF692 domain-containing protein [Stenotrophomonas sp. HITSZ_GD]MDG2526739.1 DUF692 domain-containing protein [Stenotrophomonas sp. HITSZ_GD]